MSTTSLLPFQQFFNPSTGDFLSGGKIYSYVAGSSTPQSLYSTNSTSTPLSNPVILGSDGKSAGGLWGLGNYKIIVKTSDDATTVWTVDNITFNSLAVDASGNLALNAAGTNGNITLQTTGTGTYQLLGTATSQAELLLFEQTTNGTNKFTILPPASMASDYTMTLPSASINWANINYAANNPLITPIIADAKSSSGESINSSSTTAMALATVNTNVGSAISGGVFTVPYTGVYLITGNMVFPTAASGNGQVNIYKGGVGGTSLRGTVTALNSSNQTSASVTVAASLTAADAISLAATQNSGGALNINGYLSVVRLT